MLFLQSWTCTSVAGFLWSLVCEVAYERVRSQTRSNFSTLNNMGLHFLCVNGQEVRDPSKPRGTVRCTIKGCTWNSLAVRSRAPLLAVHSEVFAGVLVLDCLQPTVPLPLLSALPFLSHQINNAHPTSHKRLESGCAFPQMGLNEVSKLF